ncbi:MAG TPA: superoxide dismutase [Bryobacteraceae bacterium]|nr:superoxide dismutase [Bryobacteraceae bacterium]
MPHKIEAKKYDNIMRDLDGISARTMTEHYKLYQGYVNKYNEIMGKLDAADRAAANQTFSDIRSLKVDLTFAIGGVKNHELYFGHLGGKGGEPPAEIKKQLEKDFGSVEKWMADLKATGIASRGWAWTGYDRDWGYLFNYAGDAQNSFPVWNAVPIVGLDVYEHAYYIDYGVARASYIDTFFKNLNWEAIGANWERARTTPRTAGA